MLQRALRYGMELLGLLLCTLALQGQDSALSTLAGDTQMVRLNTQQKDSSGLRLVRDSAQELLMGGAKNIEDTAISSLLTKIELVTTTLNKVNATIRRGFDTVGISRELAEMEPTISIIRQSIQNTESKMSQRSFLALRVLLNQITGRLKNWQGSLTKYSQQLADMEREVNAVTSDPIFNSIPRDTTLKQLYLQQARELIKKWTATSKTFNTYVKNIGVLQGRVSKAFMEVSDMENEVNFQIRDLRRKGFGKEWPYLWESVPPGTETFAGAIARSVRPNYRLGWIYLQNNWTGILTTAVLLFLLMIWVNHLYQKLVHSNTPGVLDPLRYLRKNRLVCFGLLFFTIALFVESNPPAVHVETFSLCMFLTATWLGWSDWSPAFKRWWLVLLVLFVLFGLDNLLFSPSGGERWAVLLLSILSGWTGWKLNRLIAEERSKYPDHFERVLILFIALQILSVVLNVMGRFSLAKVVGNSAHLVLAFAWSLYLLIEIVVEIIFLITEGNKSNPWAGAFQFHQFKHALRGWLVLLSAFLWMAVLLWSLNVFDDVMSGLMDWLDKHRTIGNIEFSFKSIAIFGLILYLSVAISEMLTVFFGKQSGVIVDGKRQKVGSWVLLLRLAVIGGGFLVAMAAAGIPFDKLAIVIGALGVGIGFGLQNIVSNLVSGIIMAFEKPIAVGDIVEIGTRTGTVKEIGIRSSKITTYDGSEIIVPNSDFISKEVVNWTHSSIYRRVELLVGVAYGSDLAMAKQLVNAVLAQQPGVNHHPEPVVLMHELSDSAVTIRVLFWSDFEQWIRVKSDVIAAIHERFREQGIAIPFPQTDLHIRSIDPSVVAAMQTPIQEKNSKND